MAIPEVQNSGWQQKYENGFHVIQFCNASNIYVLEPRFLADVTIWEYLYYCGHRETGYDKLKKVALNTKVNSLVREYLMPRLRSLPEERLRVFSDMRNQLSHNGKLPIDDPGSPFRELGWIGCKHYMRLFQHLTQALVLSTLGIDAIDRLGVFDVGPHLEELVSTGSVQHYEEMDKSGLDF